MALFSMRVQVISRKDGRSAVAAAAYRAGSSLTDGQGKIHDYTDKEAVERTEIMAPAGAPSWIYDRETLWQRAEAAEKRKDAQLAREIRIMLCREFTPEQRVEIVQSFVQTHFVDRGMVADIAWHNPRASDGAENPHAHVMLTMRPLDGDGFGKKSVGGRATQKRTTDWNGRELYESVREAWETTANRLLAEIGSEARIDRRSYLERGIEKIPQPYLGVAMRMKEYSTRMRQRVNQWVAQRSTSRAWAMAQKALDGQMARLEGRVDAVADAAGRVERFMHWIDDKIDRLRSAPEVAHATPTAPPSDKGIDL